MKLKDDKRTALLNIAGELGVAQLETLIADLGALRSQMDPEIAFTLEEWRNQDEKRNVSVSNDPFLAARPLKDGSVRLWLRNGGLGWMAFNLPVEKAATLRDFLIQALGSDSGGAGNLFNTDFGDGEATH